MLSFSNATLNKASLSTSYKSNVVFMLCFVINLMAIIVGAFCVSVLFNSVMVAEPTSCSY